MTPPTVLSRHVAALMYAPPDAVIAAAEGGRVRVVSRRQLTTGEHEVYSRERLLSDGVTLDPTAIDALARYLTTTLHDPRLVA